MFIKPYEEHRPWGTFREFIKNEKSTVKIITVQPLQALSLQTHTSRDEFWHVLSGSGTMTIGDKNLEALPGAEFSVPRSTEHRIEGGPEGLTVLEIAVGDFDENDIIRINDRYGR